MGLGFLGYMAYLVRGTQQLPFGPAAAWATGVGVDQNLGGVMYELAKAAILLSPTDVLVDG